MRVPYNWLQEYIDLDLSPEELAEALTLAGVEVETVEPFGDKLERVVVARVLSVERHPHSGALAVVRVDAGNGSPREVVCGAANVAPGQLVPLALPGALLPGRSGPLQVVEVGGICSQGMLCSAAELGLELPDGMENILILESPAQPGRAVARILELEEPVLSLDLTPNRADCLGLLGVAWEIAAITGAPVKMPRFAEAVEETIPVEQATRVSIRDPSLCSRYTARLIRGIKIGPSPLQMQLRLLKVGIRPICNAVDTTNYVMWEYGQPLHAFDFDLVRGEEIIVRRAEDGESLVTLDGVERNLDPQVLVIADRKRPIGLAGVMGGENTGIGPDTRNILLEAAMFDPVNIRRTARRFTLPSEASQRFERGINPEWVAEAQNAASHRMALLGGGCVLQGMVDVYPVPHRPRTLAVRPHRVNEILGVKVPERRTIEILERLGCTVERGPYPSLEVTVPLRRGDVVLEEDVVEEVARLYGYENIPVTLPRGELISCRPPLEQRLQALVRETLVAGGLSEIITLSFHNPVLLQKLRLPPNDPRLKAIPLLNPLSEEQGVMRTTLLPGLLKTVQHNLHFQEVDQLLFELGAVYRPRELPLQELPEERLYLGLAAAGRLPGANWLVPRQAADYFVLKGILENLCFRLGITAVQYMPARLPFLHPVRGALVIAGGIELGYLGQLHPAVGEAWDLDQEVTVAELALAPLLEQADPVPRCVPLPRYPASLRDIAVVVPVEIPVRDLEQVIRTAGGELVESVTLFDLYQGAQITPGKRSLAFAITYRSPVKTLTEAEVTAAHDRITAALAREGAELRGR